MVDFFIDPAYKKGLEQLGFNSIDAVFNFQAGKNLIKDNLALYRSRLEFQIDSPSTTLFLKRYNQPPIFTQLRNWLTSKKRISCAGAEFDSAKKLSMLGINVPNMVSFGQSRGLLFEKRSFVIIEKIRQAQSLEKQLPDCFGLKTVEDLKKKRDFIKQLALFIKKFHQTGFCHRDLYLCHIFLNQSGDFYLIDLARAFKPLFFNEIYRIKDLSQLYYSAFSNYFSKTDRMRFLKAYLGQKKLLKSDKILIKRIINKANRMARHDLRHGRPVPFKCNGDYNTI